MTSLSRLEKLGTIFTRVRDLMRAGVMKQTDKPVWYDVMAAFPPRHEPTFKQPISTEPLKDLLYPEDRVRARFYRTYGNQQTIDLANHEAVEKSICYRYIQKYQELETDSEQTADELMVATEDSLAAEGITLQRRGTPRHKQMKEAHSQERKPELDGLAKILQEALAKEQSPKT